MEATVLVDENMKETESNDGGAYPSTSGSSSFQHKRSCIDCHTTSTPCWRGGPAGPRTLCNACGIRYRKKKKACVGSSEGATKASSRKKASSPTGRGNRRDESLKLGLVGCDRHILLQEQWKRKMGEEERAAIVLMALSSGSVWA